MPTSNEYRQTAEECYRLANEAKTETDRLACLDLARTWLEATSRQDEKTPEQIAEAQKLERASTPKPKTPLKNAAANQINRPRLVERMARAPAQRVTMDADHAGTSFM